MLITDEVDVVVVGGVGGFKPFDDQARDVLAQLVEDLINGPAGAVGAGPVAASVHRVNYRRFAACHGLGCGAKSGQHSHRGQVND
jgi:hypothetical protein